MRRTDHPGHRSFLREPPTQASLVALLCLGALVGACGRAHESTDAGVGVDARSDARRDPPDAFMPDSPPCEDADGDGWRSGACGGEDCDDASRAVVPGTMRCVSSTDVERCVDGAFVPMGCAEPTPYCDARSDSCVDAAGACGDGVMHPREACDDGGAMEYVCDEMCRTQCDFTYQCPAGQYCIESDADIGICAPARPDGRASGERCTIDEECASGWCDVVQARCNAGCPDATSPHCPDDAYCEVDGHDFSWTPGGPPQRDYFYPCEYPCIRDADCGLDGVCTLHSIYPRSYPVMRATCLARMGAGTVGSAPIGTTCDAVLGCDSNTCIDGLCTRVCEDDSDCAAPLPHCAEHEFFPGIDLPGGMTIARVCGT